MKRILVLLAAVALMVVLLAPMAQASPPEETPPGGQDVSGKYGCSGPVEILPDGTMSWVVYSPLSKKEAEAGLASGAYRECIQNLPYQTRREAGAQSLRASLREVAGLPNGGGVAASALEDSTLNLRKEWGTCGDEQFLWGQARGKARIE